MTGEDGFPRFSEREFERRRRLILDAMKKSGVEALLIYGSSILQGAVSYLTNYLPRLPTYLIYPMDGEPTLLLHFYNHIPCTKAMSVVEDVQWYGPNPAKTVAESLQKKGLKDRAIGVVGLRSGVPYGQFVQIRESLPRATFKDMDKEYNDVRLIRSEEEIDWFRRSGHLCDLTMEALEAGIRPGVTEFELSTMIHDAFLPKGGQMVIHFISSTEMAEPCRHVPWQYITPRRLKEGDAVITEITVSYWGYGAQIHRPFAVAREPTPIYKRLFDVAVECYERVARSLRPGSTTEDVLEAASIIEEKGFAVYDSLVHGEGGGNPEIGTRSSIHYKAPFTFKENMVMVIQPNPVTLDYTAGVQLGAATVVKPNGAVSLHQYPLKFPVCGQNTH